MRKKVKMPKKTNEESKKTNEESKKTGKRKNPRLRESCLKIARLKEIRRKVACLKKACLKRVRCDSRRGFYLRVQGFKDDTRGQGTTEYAILVGVLVVIAVLAIAIFRPKIEELWNAIAEGINGL